MAADWKFAGPSGGSVNLNANASYASRVYFTANNTDVASQPSMWLVNGRASWTSAQSTVTVGLWAQNIFNKRYWINVTEYPELFGYDLNTRGRPRTYGADVTFRF